MLIFIYIVLFIIQCANSFSISFPSFIKNKAIINNIDIKNINFYEKEELKKIFNKVPILVFKNQKINPKEYYEFVKLFDDNHNQNISLYNSISNAIPDTPQIEFINNGNDNNIQNKLGILKYDTNNNYDDKYNMLWHQDATGSYKYLPPVVSSMYMLVSPLHNDDTYFASLEDAYDLMDMDLKLELSKYNTIHSNSKKRLKDTIFDYTGLRVDDRYRYDDDIFFEAPLVIYSNSLRQRRTLLLNPKRFLKFKELKPDKSYNLYRHIMKKYILNQNNIVAHHWEDFDLCIFNNRKIVHTSSPTATYNNNRIYLQCKLATNEPIVYLYNNFENIC
jgi:alpha-ketoglutarate-dependent taurine dioxygenase